MTLALLILTGVFYATGTISEPAASPTDPSQEDLSRIEYPSQENINWKPYFIRPQDDLERLFGKDWITVARFNRLDRRHAYPGVTLKVPDDIASARTYTPMPAVYESAVPYRKYILINLTEQWMGAYENGRLVFSMPAATGMEGHPTPTGLFRVDARDRNHTSSMYKTPDEKQQYPMDYAIRFYVGPDNIAYWIHARDLPGRPISHGCIGVYDETMQKRVYGTPDKPVLCDAKKLYDWATAEGAAFDSGMAEPVSDGPFVEIKGELPHYRATLGGIFSFLYGKQESRHISGPR
ncbi:MAG: L,D-transpeptidase [Smithellaceae bacterium]|nr:L,D-transpeptidase [Smithellaceae bacterium]